MFNVFIEHDKEGTLFSFKKENRQFVVFTSVFGMDSAEEKAPVERFLRGGGVLFYFTKNASQPATLNKN